METEWAAGGWGTGVRADKERGGVPTASDKACPLESALTGNRRRGRIGGIRAGWGKGRWTFRPCSLQAGGWLPRPPRSWRRRRVLRQWENGRGPAGAGGAAGMGGDVSPGTGALRAPQLDREQPASGLPEKCPHRTLTPRSSSPEARSRPPCPQCPPAPSSEGPEVGRGGCAAPLAMSSPREGPRPLPDARLPGPPRRPSSSKRRASARPGSLPSARPRRPRPGVEGGRGEHLLRVGARGHRAPIPRPSPGPRWPNVCWAGRAERPPTPRLPSRPGGRSVRPPGLVLLSGLVGPQPRAPGARRAESSPAAPSAARAREWGCSRRRGPSPCKAHLPGFGSPAVSSPVGPTCPSSEALPLDHRHRQLPELCSGSPGPTGRSATPRASGTPLCSQQPKLYRSSSLTFRPEMPSCWVPSTV